MKVLQISCGRVILCLVVSLWSLTGLQAITQLDKERFDHAVEVIDSVTSLLQAVKFASWVSKMANVVVPFLNGMSLVLDIGLYFMDIPTPEMLHLKSNFEALNYRLDTFSVEFQEVKKRIDWSAVQMSYEKYETIVRIFAHHQAAVLGARTAETMELRQTDFIWRYEHHFEMAVEVLFDAMANETSISDNVFQAAGKYTDRHPELTFRFMQGCTQLLLQALLVKSTYIHLKYNSTAADDYFKVVASELVNSVAANSKSVYNRLQAEFKSQLPIDVKRIAVTNRGVSHKQFGTSLFQYLKDKYVNRYWFVLSYDEKLNTDEEQAAMACGGGVFTQMVGRNIVVASQDKEFGYHQSGWSENWAVRTLAGVKKFKEYYQGAKALIKRILIHNNGCNPAAAVAVLKIEENSHSWYLAHDGRHISVKKEVYSCYTRLCMIQVTRYYTTIVFG